MLSTFWWRKIEWSGNLTLWSLMCNYLGETVLSTSKNASVLNIYIGKIFKMLQSDFSWSKRFWKVRSPPNFRRTEVIPREKIIHQKIHWVIHPNANPRSSLQSPVDEPHVQCTNTHIVCVFNYNVWFFSSSFSSFACISMTIDNCDLVMLDGTRYIYWSSMRHDLCSCHAYMWRKSYHYYVFFFSFVICCEFSISFQLKYMISSFMLRWTIWISNFAWSCLVCVCLPFHFLDQMKGFFPSSFWWPWEKMSLLCISLCVYILLSI